MKHFFYILLLLLGLNACKIPFSAKDTFTEKADLKIDEAPHEKNSLEWWYFTGHLEDTVKRKKLGVEYVIFQVNPARIRGAWMINMAISDPEEQKFYYDHLLVQLKNKKEFHELPLNFNWNKKGRSTFLKGQEGEYELGATMKKHPIAFELSTQALKEVVLHDGIGYEQYGAYAKAGYYTYSRLSTEGNIKLGEDTFQVSGNLWYDRQWNCSGVFEKKIAWDWFSIQFKETNTELMLYRLYHLENGEEVYGGTYIDAEGISVNLSADQIQLKELSHWRSEKSKANYPISWQISIPDLAVDVQLDALFPNQELSLGVGALPKFYYWEGMCVAQGTIQGEVVQGNSYVEMTNRFRIKE